MTTRFEGGCHCGNLTYTFETSAGFEALGLRMCACSFCRKHGQRSASDPKGSIKVSVKDPMKLKRYRFALNTTDFLICNECGVYIGAMLEDKTGAWMVVNVNTLTERPPLDFPVTLHNFDSETCESRIDRRKKVWTPLSFAGAELTQNDSAA
jgi:hypothetical protein